MWEMKIKSRVNVRGTNPRPAPTKLFLVFLCCWKGEMLTMRDEAIRITKFLLFSVCQFLRCLLATDEMR